MLTYLKIDGLALISHCEIEFAAGFNVITGETGAGKSVLLSAVSLLLGGRGDKSAIRTGAARCDICGIFQLPEEVQNELAPLLEEAGVPPCENGELQLRRVITHSGGRCHVNDTPVTVHFLREVGMHVIDVHTANEHQTLVSTQVQLEQLDRFAGAGPLREKCRELCRQRKELQVRMEEFERTMPSAAEAANFQLIVEDIQRIAPAPGEDEALSAKHELASHARQIRETADILSNLLTDGEDSVADRLAQAYRLLQDLEKQAPDAAPRFLEQCGLLSENVRELAMNVADFSGTVELDEEAYAALETRLGDLFTLKRRYGPTLEHVLQTLEEAETKLTAYRSGDTARTAFREEDVRLQKKLQSAAAELSKLRRKEAEHFAAAVGEKLAGLGFISGKLLPEWKDTAPGPNGADEFQWLFAPNPGEEPKPLRKIASSGELSRVMLALKTVLTDADQIPVSIFDEIDVNIGGETAARVGLELRDLGKRRQLLAISHLPQVAVRAEKHFAVWKSVEDGRASTQVILLQGKDRMQEIARMLGGGPAAEDHAAKLLEAAAK